MCTCTSKQIPINKHPYISTETSERQSVVAHAVSGNVLAPVFRMCPFKVYSFLFNTPFNYKMANEELPVLMVICDDMYICTFWMFCTLKFLILPTLVPCVCVCQFYYMLGKTGVKSDLRSFRCIIIVPLDVHWQNVLVDANTSFCTYLGCTAFVCLHCDDKKRSMWWQLMLCFVDLILNVLLSLSLGFQHHLNFCLLVGTENVRTGLNIDSFDNVVT